MTENPYRSPVSTAAETEGSAPTAARSFFSKLATPVYALLCVDFIWIAFDQFREQNYLRVVQAAVLMLLLATMAWRCRTAYYSAPHE